MPLSDANTELKEKAAEGERGKEKGYKSASYPVIPLCG